MDGNRRDFLKKSGLASLALMGAGLTGAKKDDEPFVNRNNRNSFNMHGYAAPPIETVGVAVIGLGNRGTGTTRRLASIEGVEIKALCDLEPDRVERSEEHTSELQSRGHLVCRLLRENKKDSDDDRSRRR